MMNKFIDWVLGRTKLRARNDYLISANNRLGVQILELRKLNPSKKQNGRVKTLERQIEALKIKLYKRHVEAQREHLLVKAMKAHMEPAVFAELCEHVNNLTDEQIAGLK